MSINLTPQSAAEFFLIGHELSAWQISFLTTAIEEVAENSPGNITDKDCLNELVQMNSQHQRSNAQVVRALTGHNFELSLSGPHEFKVLTIMSHQKRKPMPQGDFDKLYEECGWGSDAHRIALGVL